MLVGWSPVGRLLIGKQMRIDKAVRIGQQLSDLLGGHGWQHNIIPPGSIFSYPTKLISQHAGLNSAAKHVNALAGLARKPAYKIDPLLSCVFFRPPRE